MATQTQTVQVETLTLNSKNYDFTTSIGYTVAPADGSQPKMDDLASDHPLYREVRTAAVSDVRGRENEFSLEKNGFQYFKLPDLPGEGIVEFTNENDPKITGIYYAGMCDWFAKAVGAHKVVVFDHIVRHEPYYAREVYSMGIRGPAMRPHIDVTHKYAPEMFRDVQTRLGAEDTEEVLRSSHWASYNIWRPVKTVTRDAIAVLDTRTASRDQLVSASFDRGDGHIVSMDWLKSGLDPQEPDSALAHKWDYMHEQKPD